MTQPAFIMAFCKRCTKRGYTNVRIFRICNELGLPSGRYYVTAVEPLAGVTVCGEFERFELDAKFK